MANFESKHNPCPWQLSPKASQLHRSVLESFNDNDRAKFTEILTRYQQNKNIQRLVESLHQICNTPQQREEIYPLMRSFIPHKHRERFDYECSRPKSAYGRHYATYSKRHLPKYGYYTTRSLPSDTRNRQSGSSLGYGCRTPTPRSFDPCTTLKPTRERKESNARVVVLDREVEGESFGFSIRGGSEYNIGLFVSSVDEGSVAHNAGICLGDQILEVNRVDFRNISHHEAVQVIQEAPILHMLVKSVGKIPGSFKSSSSYRWTDPHGNEVSPPSQYANMMNGDKSEMRLLGADDERKVNLFVADGAEIGLKIRGGMEHGLGIFIASVERNSGADRAGIQVGDQILDVNGKSFLNISHEEAVRVLKSSQQLVIMLKDIGILPHGKRVYDETRWIRDAETKNSSRPSSASSSDRKSKTMKKTPSFHDPMGSSQLTHHSVLDHSDEILEMKARQLLPSDDLHAFAFYLNEYRATRLSLTSFLTVLSDLLNAPEKGSLFQEIRLAILPRDLAKFDEWIEKTEHSRLQAHDTDSRQTRHDRLSLYSYKSSDSSTTTNSWLGLFESGDEQRTKTNSKFRHRQDALPHPPKDFLDDSLDPRSMARDFGSRPRDSSFDLPPPPLFDLNTERTPENIGRFETKRNLGEVSLSEHSSLNKKSAEIFVGSKQISKPTVQTGQLQHRQDTSSRYTPNYSTDKKLDISEAPMDRKEHLITNVDHMGLNGEFRGIDGYPPGDSTYDDDGLYTPVDYKGSNLPNGVAEDDLYTSVDNMEFDRKHGYFSGTSMDNMQKTVFNANDTSVDNGLTSNVLQNKGNEPHTTTSNVVQNGLESFSKTNSYMENEQDDMALYATVDKSSIPPQETVNFLQENEFEIPPPIPDRIFLDTEDFEESKHNAHNINTERSRHDLINNNVAVQNKDHFVPSETGQINGRRMGRSEVARNTAVEANIASFSERLQKFTEKSSVVKSDGKESVQKSKKGKKKSKSNLSQTEESVDYSQPFVVELTKHSSNLGLSVAGGTDTDSKEIRIKSIKNEDTVAGSCPLLQPGQIILGVDEKSLQNVTSGIAAMAIRQAFHSDKTVLKLILQNDS